MADRKFHGPDFMFDDIDEHEETYRGFDVREDQGGRGPLILALAGGVLVVFGAVVWNTYAKGVRAGDDDIPVVLAEKDGYKVEGERPVAEVAPDASRRVYLQIATSPEELESGVTSASADDAVLAGAPPRDLRPGIRDEAEIQRPVPQKDDPIEVLRGPTAETEAPVTTASLESRSVPEASGLQPVKPAPEIAVATPDKPKMPEPRFAFAEGGNYQVQLVAMRSEEAANAAWTKLSSKQPDVFRGATRFVQRADLGAKGVVFRLRAGNFADRDEADAFCDAVEASGNACIVVEK